MISELQFFPHYSLKVTTSNSQPVTASVHIGRGLLLVHDAAKRWERHSPEWLGINAQVDDPFHGRPRVRQSCADQ